MLQYFKTYYNAAEYTYAHTHTHMYTYTIILFFLYLLFLVYRVMHSFVTFISRNLMDFDTIINNVLL